MKIIYPLTVFADKYGGLYSLARHQAFNMQEHQVTIEVFGSETENMNFWAFKHSLYKIGGGDTPEEAAQNLLEILKEKSAGANTLRKSDGTNVTDEELKIGAEKLIEYYYIQQWDGKLPETMLGDNSNTLIDITK